MKTVVLAYHNVGCEGIEALLRAGFEISAVFTHADDPQENVWFRSVAELAASHNIPVYAPADINHPLWVEKIRDLKPDVLFSFYYRNLIKAPILEIPPRGCLNLHGSLLPRYRGRTPVNWAILHGESETGITLHYMTPRPDDGDIVAQQRVLISDDDTAPTLFAKITQASREMLDGILPKIADGSAPRIAQNHSEATYFGGRKPADGEIHWNQSAREVRNLIRAVTRPYPGAFTWHGDRELLIWQATEIEYSNSPTNDETRVGTVLSTEPFVVKCESGALQIDFAQPKDGIYMSGEQAAREIGLKAGMTLGRLPAKAKSRVRVLVLGVNGFIGNALGERLLQDDNYEIHGMDLQADKIARLLPHPNFHFEEGDISIHREWIEYHVRKCDVVLPLVAIATPIEYVRNPLKVFTLDFEENLRVVRYCAKYGKRVVFPSTSEVYGMCDEDEFDEDNSNLVLGPIRMQRWIYSCSKQLLDRVIWAYGEKENLPFTLFRPFNFIGPRLDSLQAARVGSSRAITQLILNLVEGTPIKLVDGGAQKRCFIDVEDAIECLFRIIENKDGVCDKQILNIGNPDNEASIKELAEIIVQQFEAHPLRAHFSPFAGFQDVESGQYYGRGYQDVEHRRPSIKKARKLLGWNPTIGLRASVETTVDFFLREAVESGDFAR